MRLPDEIGIIVNRPFSRGILDERAKNRVVKFETRVVADLNLDAEWFRARLDDRDRLRITIVGDEESFTIWKNCMTKRHRFCGGCGFVQQGCISNIERRQVDDHLLEI